MKKDPLIVLLFTAAMIVATVLLVKLAFAPGGGYVHVPKVENRSLK